MKFFKKLLGGLGKTTQEVGVGIKAALGISGKMDAATKEAMEEVLLKADTGVAVATALVAELAKKLPASFEEGELKTVLAGLVEQRVRGLEKDFKMPGKPCVVLLAGVNGAGKTTTLGKLAAQWAGEGKKVLVAAADTFRAGAVGQVAVWAERAGVELETSDSGDAAAVAFKAVARGKAEKFDIVLIDTAGRLGNREDLMAELEKMVRVVAKADEAAPQHVLLVLDGTQGQATLQQVGVFREKAKVDGLIVTKLDSSAKAGFLLALAAEKDPLPVYFVGVGEKIEDLRAFEAKGFARGLVGLD